MSKSSYDCFTEMAIKILTKIPNVTDAEQLNFREYSQTEIKEFLYQCYEKGYVNFFNAHRDGNFEPHFERLIKPGLTISGYEFLNSLYASNALKNSRFAKFSSIAAILVSLLSVLSNIVLVYLSIK